MSTWRNNLEIPYNDFIFRFLFLSYRTWSLGESTFLHWKFWMKRWPFYFLKLFNIILKYFLYNGSTFSQDLVACISIIRVRLTRVSSHLHRLYIYKEEVSNTRRSHLLQKKHCVSVRKWERKILRTSESKVKVA